MHDFVEPTMLVEFTMSCEINVPNTAYTVETVVTLTYKYKSRSLVPVAYIEFSTGGRGH